MTAETFYALSTIIGKSGLAVVRISGPECSRLIADMGYKKVLRPRHAIFHRLLHPETKAIIDEIIFLYFKSPNSFTGEDTIELHLHGSKAVIKEVINCLSNLPYIRLAEPGEFSRQAFLNGKMDLTQAEGLAELIEAETSIQREIALRQMSGEAASLYSNWRQQIIMLLSSTEALIDFPTDDLPDSTKELIDFQCDRLKIEIKHHLSESNDMSSLAEGIKIVILGPPNVGKSSLMNYIARSDVAIVSDIAGTTRDIIKVKFDLSGFPVILADTAGLNDTTNDAVEQKGIKIAQRAAETSDINLLVLSIDHDNKSFIKSYLHLFHANTIVLLNKVDMAKPNSSFDLEMNLNELSEAGLHICKAIIPISVAQDYGIKQMLELLKEMIAERYTPANEPMLTKARYRESLMACLDHLELVDPYSPMMDITAEELRMAAMAIGQITGQVMLEEVLDQVFSAFCIGK
jgi:tRNA modification GTPase